MDKLPVEYDTPKHLAPGSDQITVHATSAQTHTNHNLVGAEVPHHRESNQADQEEPR